MDHLVPSLIVSSPQVPYSRLVTSDIQLGVELFTPLGFIYFPYTLRDFSLVILTEGKCTHKKFKVSPFNHSNF